MAIVPEIMQPGPGQALIRGVVPPSSAEVTPSSQPERASTVAASVAKAMRMTGESHDTLEAIKPPGP